ncbi:DinB family protein [Peribacillus sp. NJ4]|uniref:DinB family protein n=1 Tax=Peribacillus TaxID=2675229 RepID=UPI0025A106F0|nr:MULTISPECIES: DinB family protein [unclassified Peribacillus]MDM5213876.1 DinB family protein [Peribacillus sp. NJ4]MDM5224250.1 DinB family protein [Peribacillus sp. NJ11]
MNYVKNQLTAMRSNLLKEIEGINPEFMDVQPEGFNNTIHWHLGHVLTAAEKFLLNSNSDLPENYSQLFGYGSKPADWTGDVPSVEVLKQQLQEQLGRLLEIPEERLTEKAAQPFNGMETVGEFINFVVLHEANHIGQIHAMKLFIKKSTN